MIVPPFIGQEVIQSATQIADAKGYVKVRDTYQAQGYNNVYAVGIAAAVDVPWQTATPVGVPKTGFPTERMAHVAARNIAAQIRGEMPRSHEAFGDMQAVCVMDAGNNGVIILADKMLPPRKHGVLIPGPQAHASNQLKEHRPRRQRPGREPCLPHRHPRGPLPGRAGGHVRGDVCGRQHLELASFQLASWLGYPNLVQQAPELSAAIVTVCLAVPMAVYMAIRGHGRRHNLEMTASTLAVGMVVIGLLASGAIATSGLQNWHNLFGADLRPGLPGHDRGDADQFQHVQRTERAKGTQSGAGLTRARKAAGTVRPAKPVVLR